MGWGQAMTDASYFLGGSLTLEDRRAHEQELLREYHEALQEHGVRGFGWEECWEGYRRQAFLGVLMTVAPAMLVQRTERGDEMFLVTLARYAQQVLDLDAIELLPEPGSGRPPALRPEPADEAPHEPGPEELWNESWYFDAVSADESVGVYTRLGLYPNLGVSWMTAFVCGPGRETVALIDFAAPLPQGEQLSLSSEQLRAEHICIEPLESFEVRLQGTAESFQDAAAILRGERGDPTELALALRWDTDGEPYAYRATTRYEIPCRVSGTVRCGEETIELAGVGPARPFVGGAGLVVGGVDVVGGSPAGRHPPARGRVSPARSAPDGRRLLPAAGGRRGGARRVRAQERRRGRTA